MIGSQRIESRLVTIRIPPSLSELTGGMESVQVERGQVGQCLRQLADSFPGLRNRLFDGDGQLKSFVEIYVNQTSYYPRELTREVEDEDQIQIVEAIAGG